jgi:hypothetical protein
MPEIGLCSTTAWGESGAVNDLFLLGAVKFRLLPAIGIDRRGLSSGLCNQLIRAVMPCIPDERNLFCMSFLFEFGFVQTEPALYVK